MAMHSRPGPLNAGEPELRLALEAAQREVATLREEVAAHKRTIDDMQQQMDALQQENDTLHKRGRLAC